MNLTRLIGGETSFLFFFPSFSFDENIPREIDSSWRFRFNEERNRNFIFR